MPAQRRRDRRPGARGSAPSCRDFGDGLRRFSRSSPAARTPQLAAFAVRVAATDVRAGREAIRIALGGERLRQTSGRREIYTPSWRPTSICWRCRPGPTSPARPPTWSAARSVGADRRRPATSPAPTCRRRAPAARRELETLGTRGRHARVAAVGGARAPGYARSPPLARAHGRRGQRARSRRGVALADGTAGRDVDAHGTAIGCSSTNARSRPISSTGPSRRPSRCDVSLTLPVEGVPAVHRPESTAPDCRPSDYARRRRDRPGALRLPQPGGRCSSTSTRAPARCSSSAAA